MLREDQDLQLHTLHISSSYAHIISNAKKQSFPKEFWILEKLKKFYIIARNVTKRWIHPSDPTPPTKSCIVLNVKDVQWAKHESNSKIKGSEEW